MVSDAVELLRLGHVRARRAVLRDNALGQQVLACFPAGLVGGEDLSKLWFSPMITITCLIGVVVGAAAMAALMAAALAVPALAVPALAVAVPAV